MKIAGVLLAAGNSTRFGADKLHHTLASGEAMGLRSARLVRSELDVCIAVIRDSDRLLGEELSRMGLSTILQPTPEAGMGNSLALGIRATEQADAWLIALADMPWIQPGTYQQVISSLHNDAPLVVPFFNDKRGHPVGFSRRFREELMALDGDSGARRIIESHTHELHRIDVDDPGILRDVDRLQDLD